MTRRRIIPYTVNAMTAHPHNRQVAARFSAAASTYAEASALQERVARHLFAMIPDGLQPASILDAGCGTGRLLRHARQRWPAAHLTGVDMAPGMIAEARTVFANDPAATFEVADLAAFAPPCRFDLVLSGSALHWTSPLAASLKHLANLCRPQGLLAVGMMLEGTLGELHEARKAVAPHKPPPGSLPTYAAFEQAARQIPHSRIRRLEQTSAGYDQPSALEALRTLHAMGVTGGDLSHGDAALTRGELRALAAWYDQHFASPQGVHVTFVVGYLLLECEPPRRP